MLCFDSMTKTLVTIGYHYGELDWGRQVRDAYLKSGLKNGRDIEFYEVRNSRFETSDLDFVVQEEIEEILEKNHFWIDIHCGFDTEKDGKMELLYYSSDPKALNRVNLIPDVNINDCRRYPDKEGIHPQYARADVFFPRKEFETKGPIYQKGLERTLLFINQMHDLH